MKLYWSPTHHANVSEIGIKKFSINNFAEILLNGEHVSAVFDYFSHVFSSHGHDHDPPLHSTRGAALPGYYDGQTVRVVVCGNEPFSKACS